MGALRVWPWGAYRSINREQIEPEKLVDFSSSESTESQRGSSDSCCPQGTCPSPRHRCSAHRPGKRSSSPSSSLVCSVLIQVGVFPFLIYSWWPSLSPDWLLLSFPSLQISPWCEMPHRKYHSVFVSSWDNVQGQFLRITPVPQLND